MPNAMRIGELGDAAGVDVETIRYYERAGLLSRPAREANGYRSYARPHLEQLSFIRHCRALDMPLADIGRLLELLTRPDVACADVDRLVDEQLARVRARIGTLRSLERQLSALRARCVQPLTAAECGILNQLVSAAHHDTHLTSSTPPKAAPGRTKPKRP